MVYDAAKQELVCKARRNPLRPVDGKVRLQILAERNRPDYGEPNWNTR